MALAAGFEPTSTRVETGSLSLRLRQRMHDAPFVFVPHTVLLRRIETLFNAHSASITER